MNKIIIIGHGEEILQTITERVRKAGLESIVINLDNHSLDALPYLIAPHKETMHERQRAFSHPHPSQVINTRTYKSPSGLTYNLDDNGQFQMPDIDPAAMEKFRQSLPKLDMVAIRSIRCSGPKRKKNIKRKSIKKNASTRTR